MFPLFPFACEKHRMTDKKVTMMIWMMGNDVAQEEAWVFGES